VDDLFEGRLANTDGLMTTVCYLDDPPASVASRLKVVLQKRWAGGAVTPLLAAPFEAVRPGDLSGALPDVDRGDGEL
jgi:hypothetical protein